MEEKKNKPILPICILSIVIAVIIIVVILIMSGGETRTSETEVSTKQEILQCSTSTPTESFFKPNKNTSGTNYIVKYIYEDDKVQSASFNYVTTFDTEEIAENELANMKFKFYEYIANTNMDEGDLDPIFNRYANDISISLYFDKKHLTPRISDLLFLDKTAASKLQKYSLKDLEKIYRDKKFSCKNNEYNNQN